MPRLLTEHLPLMQIDTRLDLIPRAWLEFIEPRIQRGKGEYPSCWLFTTEDGLAPSHGEPRIYVNRKPLLLKYFIAEMFWPGIQCRGQGARHFVYHQCGVINCLNPNHFLVCFDHPRWINLDPIVRLKQNSLRRYAKELLRKKSAHALSDDEGE